MPESTNDHTRIPNDAESALGGADAVEKTTYVVGAGTEPERRTPTDGPPPVANAGTSWVVWAVVAVAVIIGVVYLVGMARH